MRRVGYLQDRTRMHGRQNIKEFQHLSKIDYHTKFLKLRNHNVVPTSEIRTSTTQVLAKLVNKTHKAVGAVAPCFTEQASWKYGILTLIVLMWRIG